MSNRSVELFHKAHESFEKFDYFICGVSGALFACVGQHYVPQKFHLGAPALEPLSLACFVVSFFVGLGRIETTAHSKRLNALMLDAAEKAGALLKALAAGGKGPYLNIEGGDISDQQTLEAQYKACLEERESWAAELEPITRKALRLYKIRDWFLISGVSILFLAKVLQPYYP